MKNDKRVKIKCSMIVNNPIITEPVFSTGDLVEC